MEDNPLTQVNDEATFARLLERARQGSDEAAWALVETYGPYVLRAIRRTLSREIRGKFDSDDFAQAVWASFFAAAEQFEGITEPRHFVGLLTTMARNKVIDEMRRSLLSQKCSVLREQPIEGVAHGAEALHARGPSPSQFAIARERWFEMLKNQPDRERQVMRLKLMGRTNRSIATQLQLNERTVRRILERLTLTIPVPGNLSREITQGLAGRQEVDHT